MSLSGKALSVLSMIGVFTTVAGVLPARAAFGDRITVSGTEFRAGTNRIWINGANTPWHVWNDFGGRYNAGWWNKHFKELHENGINATRVWISCNGDVGINIDESGNVSGCTTAFWSHLDSLFEIARKQQVYIKATLISFDHFSDGHKTTMHWRNMITNSASIDSLVAHYVVSFVNRYKDNPWLWCIDLCNEPDWVHENARSGKIAWDPIQTYFAKAAAAIHANSKILVTVGISMGSKYNSGTLGVDVLSDSALQSRAGGDALARLDFFSPHHYDWMVPAYGNPFYKSPTAYGMDGTRPVVIGEAPAKGTAGHTTTEDYENGCRNGWQGAMGWTSNGVDANGGLGKLGPATRAFRDKHWDLVFPGTTAPVSTPSPGPVQKSVERG
jgi:hypothetical protein